MHGSLHSFADAENLYQRAIKMLLPIHNGAKSTLAGAYCQLGEAYRRDNKYSEAERCFRKSLDLYESSQTIATPIALNTIGLLADDCRCQRKFAEAICLSKRGLSYCNQSEQLQNTAVFGQLLEVAAMSSVQKGDLLEAEPYFLKAKTVFDKAFGNDCSQSVYIEDQITKIHDAQRH
jgi:tetratricopeptide (TPR) repeat protein